MIRVNFSTYRIYKVLKWNNLFLGLKNFDYKIYVVIYLWNEQTESSFNFKFYFKKSFKKLKPKSFYKFDMLN